MSTLPAFNLPAMIQDFPAGSPQAEEMSWRWNINVSAWINQALLAAASNGAPYFYNPTTTDIPDGTAAVPVTWGAFPGRLTQFYSAQPPVQPANPNPLTQEQIYSLADSGFYEAGPGDNPSFPEIPATLCPQANWQGQLKTFGPYGPRGWLDEYCEWCVTHDAAGNILRVDFACENPEYWNTLWKVDPSQVAALYESTLNWDAPPERQITVTVADLQMTDGNGNPVIDPETGRPFYNPLNTWNYGPRAGRFQDRFGGVMHLTSTPNTLQTELGLAGTSTIQFQPPGGTGNSDPQALICCGEYGQEYRHSDPHIGQTVNQVVQGTPLGIPPQTVCLADPVGLYIQLPANPSAFTFAPSIVVGRDVPQGANAVDIWQVVRGSATLTDPVTNANFPGNFVLHAVAQIPSAWLAMNPNLTLTDILINGQPIQWAGQIANQFEIGLYARPVQAAGAAPPSPCASSSASPDAAPLQCLDGLMWATFYPQTETAPTGAEMSLASNTTFIPPYMACDGGTRALAVTYAPSSTGATPSITFGTNGQADPSITVTVTGGDPNITYAVPGNSYPGPCAVYYLDVVVAPGAAAGPRDLMFTTGGQTQSLPAAIYLLGAV